MNFIRNLFAPTHGSLIASMTKTVTKLEALAERQFTQADNHRIDAEALHSKADALEIDGGLASRTASRIRALFS